MREEEFLKEQEKVRKTRKAMEEIWKLGVEAEKVIRPHTLSLSHLTAKQEFIKAKEEKKLREEAEQRKRDLDFAEAQRKAEFERVQSSVQGRRAMTLTKKEQAKKEAERQAEILVWPWSMCVCAMLTLCSARSGRPTKTRFVALQTR
jgi:hypothetical protein